MITEPKWSPPGKACHFPIPQPQKKKKNQKKREKCVWIALIVSTSQKDTLQIYTASTRNYQLSQSPFVFVFQSNLNLPGAAKQTTSKARKTIVFITGSWCFSFDFDNKYWHYGILINSLLTAWHWACFCFWFCFVSSLLFFVKHWTQMSGGNFFPIYLY